MKIFTAIPPEARELLSKQLIALSDVTLLRKSDALKRSAFNSGLPEAAEELARRSLPSRRYLIAVANRSVYERFTTILRGVEDIKGIVEPEGLATAATKRE